MIVVEIGGDDTQAAALDVSQAGGLSHVYEPADVVAEEMVRPGSTLLGSQ